MFSSHSFYSYFWLCSMIIPPFFSIVIPTCIPHLHVRSNSWVLSPYFYYVDDTIVLFLGFKMMGSFEIALADTGPTHWPHLS